MDIIAYLDSKGIELKETLGGQAYTHCFFCNEDTNKHGRLYFNVEEGSEKYGLYTCFLCQQSGGINSLMRHFGDDPISEDVSDLTSLIMHEASLYYAEKLLENVAAYEYLLHNRGLTDEIIRKARFGWADGGLLQHLLASGYALEAIQETGLVNRFGNDFLEDKITIPYMDYGRTITIRGKQIDGKYLSLPGSTSQLYGCDSVRGEQTIVLAAGEFDCAVLQQMGYAAAGVPGENTWKSEWLETISDAVRIFIMFDQDIGANNVGKAAAEKLASKIGPRSRVVELPKGPRKVDVSSLYVEENKTREDFDTYIMKAKGGLLVSVSEAYDRWLEIEGNPNLLGLRFNVDEFDNVMRHGILPGQVITLMARTNTGKTIMTINIMHRMLMKDPNIKFLYISLEQTRNEWFERAHRINNFYNPGATVLDTIAFWNDNLLMVDKNRISEQDLEVCIDQYLFDSGEYPDVVVIDYLGYYGRSFRGDEYTRITDAIMGLKGIAKDRRNVFFVPHQANRSGNFGQEMSPDQGRGSGAVEETSDMMMALWNPDQQLGVSEGDQKRELHMKILKSRDGGGNVKARFQFAPLTLAVVPMSDPLYPRALREMQYLQAGADWERAVYMHRTGDESVKL